MKRVSDKRAKQFRQYKIVKNSFMQDNTNCNRCSGVATEVHHTNGRYGERLNDVNYFMAVCRNCHIYIHSHPQESREKKWLH